MSDNSVSSEGSASSQKSNKSEKSEPSKVPSKTPPPSEFVPKGKLTRNPFVNFVREFRAQHKELYTTEVIKQAALKWNKMTEAEKLKYREQANSVPKRKTTRKRKREGSVISVITNSSSGSTTDDTRSKSRYKTVKYVKKRKSRVYPKSKKSKKAIRRRDSYRKPQRKRRHYGRGHNLTQLKSNNSFNVFSYNEDKDGVDSLSSIEL